MQLNVISLLKKNVYSYLETTFKYYTFIKKKKFIVLIWKQRFRNEKMRDRRMKQKNGRGIKSFELFREKFLARESE